MWRVVIREDQGRPVSKEKKEAVTVKPEITHTLGGHQKLWVITGYGFSQVYLHMCYKSWWTQNAMGYHRLWVITVWVISGLTA